MSPKVYAMIIHLVAGHADGTAPMTIRIFHYHLGLQSGGAKMALELRRVLIPRIARIPRESNGDLSRTPHYDRHQTVFWMLVHQASGAILNHLSK
jgi:hypothetical protein